MRRYRDLIVREEYPSQEWWEARAIIEKVMEMVDAGNSQAAAKLLKSGLLEFPELLEDFTKALADRLGPKPMGRKIKNTPERLLEIYDFYRLETEGRVAARLEQLASKYDLEVATMIDLLDAGRALGRSLAAEGEAEWEQQQELARENPESNDTESWDTVLEAVARLKKSTD